jgi:acyl-CoA thioester hydrolase
MAETLLIHEGRVSSDWIDYNGHMRDGYYAVVCSDATDNLMDHFGIDEDYRGRTQRTAYTLELKIRFLAELAEDEPFFITAQMLGSDSKRYHVYLRMFRKESGELAATHESVMLHVDQAAGPASVPFPDEIAARVAALTKAHKDLPFPDDASRPISLTKKKAAS